MRRSGSAAPRPPPARLVAVSSARFLGRSASARELHAAPSAEGRKSRHRSNALIFADPRAIAEPVLQCSHARCPSFVLTSAQLVGESAISQPDTWPALVQVYRRHAPGLAARRAGYAWERQQLKGEIHVNFTERQENCVPGRARRRRAGRADRTLEGRRAGRRDTRTGIHRSRQDPGVQPPDTGRHVRGGQGRRQGVRRPTTPALVLPGGVANPDFLRTNADAVAFAKGFFDAGKPVAVICHGPVDAGGGRRGARPDDDLVAQRQDRPRQRRRQLGRRRSRRMLARPKHIGFQPQTRRPASLLQGLGRASSRRSHRSQSRPANVPSVGNVAAMLMAALRDMQWRRRRFVIAILSTAIIFAMTLVLTGLANGFRVEAEKTVDSLGRRPVHRQGRRIRPVRRGDAVRTGGIAHESPNAPGVDAAAPLAYAGGTATLGGSTRNVDIFGAPENGPGMPAVSEGRPPSSPDEVAVSSTLGKADRRRSRDRVAQTAHRRHRGELHGAGEPAQRLPHHRGRATTRVCRRAACRIDRYSRHARAGARRLSRHRPKRRGRRSAAAAEGGRQLDHDRGRSALGGRRTGRRIGDLSVCARASARLRGVQGDWRSRPRASRLDSRCRRSSWRCSPRLSAPALSMLLGPLFPMQVIVPARRSSHFPPSPSSSG